MAGVLNGVKPGDQLAEIANRAGGFEPALRIWVVESVSATTCRAGRGSDRASFYLSTGKLISRTMSSRVVPGVSMYIAARSRRGLPGRRSYTSASG